MRKNSSRYAGAREMMRRDAIIRETNIRVLSKINRSIFYNPSLIRNKKAPKDECTRIHSNVFPQKLLHAVYGNKISQVGFFRLEDSKNVYLFQSKKDILCYNVHERTHPHCFV
jgi:hypothetical protein